MAQRPPDSTQMIFRVRSEIPMEKSLDPILVITEPDGEVRKFPADRTIIEAGKKPRS
ncbi:hypothetical protein GCM10010412_093410 [Nonomuraea recticatena]|uniref:Uncharacterized protein n=1 Tax=Nonomuraea recticatena TaxID=46178 RepID=A0ABN3TA18_9ACTN